MLDNPPPRRPHPPRPWVAMFAVALTAAACLTALVLRTPLRSRYWAWRVERAATPLEHSVYLGALCNAADQGRWGTGVLLAHADAEMRQYGVLVLHHVRTAWARKRLLERVADADPDVRRLAAAGLAIHGDNGVIPTLKWLYQTGDASSAATACLALERLGTADAIAALNELTLAAADVAHRAALVDALAGINAPECVPALVRLLSDQRACDMPSRSEETARRILSELEMEAYPFTPSSLPTTGRRPRTIAERAAAALAELTGLHPPFAADAPEEQRTQAERVWAEWDASRHQQD